MKLPAAGKPLRPAQLPLATLRFIHKTEPSNTTDVSAKRSHAKINLILIQKSLRPLFIKTTYSFSECKQPRTEIDGEKSRNSTRWRTKVVCPPTAESCFPFEEMFPIKPFKALTSSVDLLACREWDVFCGR